MCLGSLVPRSRLCCAPGSSAVALGCELGQPQGWSLVPTTLRPGKEDPHLLLPILSRAWMAQPREPPGSGMGPAAGTAQCWALALFETPLLSHLLPQLHSTANPLGFNAADKRLFIRTRRSLSWRWLALISPIKAGCISPS